MAVITVYNHPLKLECESVERYFDDSVSVRDILDSMAINLRWQDLLVTVDGVTAAENSRVYPNSIMVIRPVLHGGGGVFSSLLSIAGLFIPGLQPFSFGALIAKGLFTIGGALLISFLTPSRDQSRNVAGDQQRAAPVFSVTGARNQARPYEPLPIVLGTHRMFPDLGAQPFTSKSGNDQELNMILNFGVDSDLKVTDIRIGDTPINRFKDVDTQLSSNGDGRITLIPNDVDTVAGAVLVDNAWVTRTTAENTRRIYIDFEYRLSDTNLATGEQVPYTTEYSIQYRPVSGGSWIVVADNAPLKSKGSTLKRKSIAFPVSSGQYEVRVRRARTRKTTSRFIDDLNYTTMRNYQTHSESYEKQKRLGLRIRASNQLQGVIEELNALVEARIPTSITDDTPRSTSNPAWEFLYIARGFRLSDGRRLFGALLDDSQIDLDAIQDWAAFCTANDLRCDIVFAGGRLTTAEMLTVIAQCGRASLTWTNGKLGIVFDEANKLPVALFNMSNMVRDSFTVRYITDNTIDQIIARFSDESRDYRTSELRVTAPGVSTPVNPTALDFNGVVRSDQVRREANLAIAQQIYHRRVVSFAASMGGMYIQRGDVVQLAHDTTDWGYSGRVVEAVSTTITLAVKVTAAIGDAIDFQYPDGTVESRTFAAAATDENVVTIDSPITALDGYNTLFIVDTTGDGTPGKLMRVTSVSPQQNGNVRFELIDERPEYYAFEDTPVVVNPPPDTPIDTPRIVSIAFSETLIDFDGNTRIEISVSAENSISILGEYQLDDLDVVSAGTLEGGILIIENVPQNTVITFTATPVALVSLTPVEPLTETYVVQGLNTPPPDVTGFVVSRTDNELIFNWSPVLGPDGEVLFDLSHYEIRRGSTWTNSFLLVNVDKLNTFLIVTDTSGGDYFIKAVDVAGNKSENATAILNVPSADQNVLNTLAEPPFNGTHLNTFEVVGEGVTIGATNEWSTFTSAWDTYTQSWVAESNDAIEGDGTYTLPKRDLGAVLTSHVQLDAVVGLYNPNAAATPWTGYFQPWAFYSSPDYTWEGAVGNGIATFEWRYSDDDIVYTDWDLFAPGTYSFRYHQFRVNLFGTGDSESRSILKSIDIVVDVPDQVEVFEDFAIASGGSTVTFTKQYTQVPNVQVTVQDGVTGDTAVVDQKSTTSVDVEVFDSTNTTKAANVDIHVRGF